MNPFLQYKDKLVPVLAIVLGVGILWVLGSSTGLRGGRGAPTATPGISASPGGGLTGSPSPRLTVAPRPGVYRNSAFGFEIRYPAGILVHEKEERSSQKDPQGFYTTSLAWLGYSGVTQPASLRISVREHAIYFSLSDYSRLLLTFSNQNYKLYSLEGLPISGVQTVKVVEEWIDTPYGRTQSYVFERRGKFLLFSFPVSSRYANTFDTIVLSLIFTR